MWLGRGADVGKSRRRCGLFGFEVFGAYVTSLYWAITTLTTIGYGDICPQNRYEKIYAIFVMCARPAPYYEYPHAHPRMQGERNGDLLDDHFDGPRRVRRNGPRGEALQPVPREYLLSTP
jgi:hypothetical protein